MNKNPRELLDNAIALREDGREKQDPVILNHALNLLLNLSETDPENAERNYQIGFAYDNSG